MYSESNVSRFIEKGRNRGHAHRAMTCTNLTLMLVSKKCKLPDMPAELQ